MLGRPTPEENERWQAIVADYQRHKKLGGAEGDPSIRVTNGLIDIARSVAALQPQQPLAETVQAVGGELSSQFGRQIGEQLAQQLAQQMTRLVEQQARQLQPLQQNQQALAEQLATPLAAVAQLARQLESGQAQSQQQLRASLDATAQAVQTLEASTRTLAANSQAAESQRMIDALLSLSVTYRQLIMPLVNAIERLGVGGVNHGELDRVQRQIDHLADPSDDGNPSP
jgi:DNA repair exonuclease SbcCD ATPase subunit